MALDVALDVGLSAVLDADLNADRDVALSADLESKSSRLEYIENMKFKHNIVSKFSISLAL